MIFIFFLILLIIINIFPIRIKIGLKNKINRNILFISFLNFKFNINLKKVDIKEIIRKYSINKEKRKIKKFKTVIKKILPAIYVYNLQININTYNEYIYFFILLMNSYFLDILYPSLKKVKNYKLNFERNEEHSFDIFFDFSFQLYEIIFVLIRKNKINRGVVSGKSSKRNNEIIFR